MVVFLGAYRNSSSSQGKQYPTPPHGEYSVINAYLAVEKMESRMGYISCKLPRWSYCIRVCKGELESPTLG